MNRTEPSMSRKFPPPGCWVWKAAGLASGRLTVYWRLWTRTAVMAGREFWQPSPLAGVCRWAPPFPSFPLATRSNHNRYAQVGRRDGGGAPVEAPVLALEQRFQFLLQVGRTAALFRRVERIHRRPVIPPERRHELG